jgi:2,3-bisphosphoglycerate-dependent phosphoglycerate mutase
MELYIIRHAQSTNNAAEVLTPGERVNDPPLTELGHQQAAALAKHLCDGFNPEGINDALYALDASARQMRGFHLTKLYCSPMYRSLQTTKYIADATGLIPHVWRDIHEHGGMYLEYPDERGIVGFPGRTRAEILSEFPTYVLTDEITDMGWWTGALESIHQAQARALLVADDLRHQAQESPDERIAIVSHGTFVNQLIKALLNQLPSRGQWFHHLNTAITRVDFIPERGLAVQYVNRVDHLSPELISG